MQVSGSPACDDLGTPVPVPAEVTRVVSLVPSLTESLAATAPGLLVGATDWCTQPPDLAVRRVRGTKNPDLDALKVAARKAAIFEETAIYKGFGGAGILGMLDASSHPPVPLSSDRNGFTESVELALLAIQKAEIGGPFALVLGTEPYKWLMAGDPNAYPLRKRIQALVLGGIYWSPALEGGAVISRRGGDFEMTVGQDLAIGYKLHDAKEVELYFAESFTFRVLEPAAAVELKLQ